MSQCSSDCGSCGASCPSRESQEIKKDAPHSMSKIRKVIGVVSGKGGVGKSMVTSLLATAMSRRGKETAVLDADITGPSIPRIFGIEEGAKTSQLGLHPSVSAGGIKIMSVNLLMEDESDPVIWRGPVIAGVVRQFWTDVVWEEVEFMFVDMPPGTGDVPLTVFQSLPVDGIVVVVSPQELVSMIVKKAINMAKMMNIPILGLVENYSYFTCPDCGGRHSLFGESSVDELAADTGLKVLAKVPVDSKMAAACDRGELESYECSYMDGAADEIIKSLIG